MGEMAEGGGRGAVNVMRNRMPESELHESAI